LIISLQSSPLTIQLVLLAEVEFVTWYISYDKARIQTQVSTNKTRVNKVYIRIHVNTNTKLIVQIHMWRTPCGKLVG